MLKTLDKLLELAAKLVFKTPKSFGDAIWRFVSFSTCTTFIVSGLLLWRYPKIVHRFISNNAIEEQLISEIFRRNPQAKEEVMTLLGRYIARYHPTQVSLINWTSQTGIIEVWSNEDSTRWPTSTHGVMSENMREPAGYLIFDDCWQGRLEKSSHILGRKVLEDNDWVICGISDAFDIWGYVIVHWEGSSPPVGAVNSLENLARTLERVIFAHS